MRSGDPYEAGLTKKPDRTILQMISIRSGIPIGSLIALYYELGAFYKAYLPNVKQEELRAFAENDIKTLFERLEKNRVHTPN